MTILATLKCDESVKGESMKLLEASAEAGLLTATGPEGQAAGIVYVSCILARKRLSQAVIGRAAGVSSGVVGKNYIRIARGLGYGER